MVRQSTPSLQTKREALEQAYFGQNAAERDRALQQTFVETPVWTGILNDSVDVVFGAKGAGKSAMVVLLGDRRETLRKKGIVIVNAESLGAEPVFRMLTRTQIPLKGPELIELWKLYLLTLLGSTLRTLTPHDIDAQAVVAALEEAGLLPRDSEPRLESLLKGVLTYVTLELAADAHVGVPGTPIEAGGEVRISSHEPASKEHHPGILSFYDLLQKSERALAKARLTVWFVLDRLDVAFEDDPALEAHVLRALFRASLALSPTRDQHLRFKIFLRSDIWERIAGQFAYNADGGERFSQAAAIQSERILWDPPSLRSLVARRLAYNAAVCKLYHIDARKMRESAREQQGLFSRIFPPQMPVEDTAAAAGHVSTPRPSGYVLPQPTFDWMLSQVRDGTGQVAPRDLILLLTEARSAQLRRFAAGDAEALDGKDYLFEPEALEEAAAQVSHDRLFQTLFAEYPHLYRPVMILSGGPSQFTSLESLQQVWQIDEVETQNIVTLLTHLGFFGYQKAQQPTACWIVPPLYQRELGLRP